VTNKPKAIGTRGETAIVNVLRAHGFGGAERRALAGSNDLGDILICPGVIAEVKWGKHAKTASLVDVSRWLRETERERANAGAHLGSWSFSATASAPTGPACRGASSTSAPSGAGTTASWKPRSSP
jgi:hypothetical protein